jgi:phosphoserine phosphatase
VSGRMDRAEVRRFSRAIPRPLLDEYAAEYLVVLEGAAQRDDAEGHRMAGEARRLRQILEEAGVTVAVVSATAASG